jgi:anti-sigma regulatory factor (Ser/Thr protein kinase)
MPAEAVRPVRQHHMVMPGITPQAMEPVRKIVCSLLQLWHKSELSYAAELGVTELLSNVWKHTAGDCELLIRETPDGVLVSVTDFDDVLPVVREPSADCEGGRGLLLLSVLADELETQTLLRGKQVWFRLRSEDDDNPEI